MGHAMITQQLLRYTDKSEDIALLGEVLHLIMRKEYNEAADKLSAYRETIIASQVPQLVRYDQRLDNHV